MRRRRQVVVEAPADVLRLRLAAVAPPRVLLRVRVERAEHVDQAELARAGCVIQARSSGRKPLFLRLPFQFFRSISWCAMLMSPTG